VDISQELYIFLFIIYIIIIYISLFYYIRIVRNESTNKIHGFRRKRFMFNENETTN